jgi:hypothetical protein
LTYHFDVSLHSALIPFRRLGNVRDTQTIKKIVVRSSQSGPTPRPPERFTSKVMVWGLSDYVDTLSKYLVPRFNVEEQVFMQDGHRHIGQNCFLHREWNSSACVACQQPRSQPHRERILSFFVLNGFFACLGLLKKNPLPPSDP